MNSQQPSDLESLRIERQDAPTVPAPASRWRTRILIPATLLALTVVLLVSGFWGAIAPATPVRVIPCVVRSAEGSTAAVTFQASGWIEPDPFPIYVSALTSGVVADVLVLEGDTVDAGAVVARLVPDDARLRLEAAAAELALREAEARAREVEANAASRRLDTLIERDRDLEVARSEKVRRTSELTGARAAHERALALVRTREVELERKRGSVSSGAVSKLEIAVLEEQLAADRALAKSTAADVSAAEAILKTAAAREEAAAKNRELLIDERGAAEVAKAELDAARARFEIARARHGEAKLALDRVDVRSAVAGTVLERIVAPGSVVGTGAGHSMHMVHLYDPKKLQVRADVPLAEAALVAIGQRAEISVETLPDTTFAGRVTRVVHLADIQKNTVEVKVAIDAPSEELKPEMLARVRFLGQPAKVGEDDEPVPEATRYRVFAPTRLLETTGDRRASVLVVVDLSGDRGRAEERTVTLGRSRRGAWVEIEDGLRAGDRLIAEPRTGIEDGDRVVIIDESADDSKEGP